MSVALMAGSIAAPIIGGVIGNMASAGDRKKAQQAMQDALYEIDAVGAPPDLSKEIILNKLKEVGVLTPELEQQIDIGISKVSQIQEDPQLRQQQLTALNDISKRGRVGLTAEERAELNKVRNSVQRDSEAKRQQILQNMQARGMAGSGNELASQLISSQEGANRASEESDRVMSMAQQRALAAMSQSGQMAGQLRGQDFDVERTKTSAEDEFRRFDVGNQVSREQRRASGETAARDRNLQRKEQVSDTNTQAANQELYRQAEAKRQHWQDTLSRATARASARTGQAGYYQGLADRTSNQWSKIGSGVGSGLSSMGAAKPGATAETPPAEPDDYNRRISGAR